MKIPRPVEIQFDAARGTFALVFEIGAPEAEELLSEALALHGDVPARDVTPQDSTTSRKVTYS